MTRLNVFNQANFAFATPEFDSPRFGGTVGLTGASRIIHFELGMTF